MLPKDITQPILNYSHLLACNCNQPLSTFYFKEKKKDTVQCFVV